MAVEIQGAEQLATLARRLKEAGDKDLQRELAKGISRATKPIKDAAKASARQGLPRRGGLAERVARSRFTTRRTKNGVRVVVSSKDALRRIDRGIVRHPVFGNTDVWVDQPVTPGWWSRPTEAAGPQARREVLAALDAVAAKVNRPL